ncbi:MAG: PhnD/SsuA/transferrin family substrate-binding protein [Lentisphaeria bacterium]|nr:PhnD/SsuA/transferrin family substrate-binding protein [Lentisphaeria bacterium]
MRGQAPYSAREPRRSIGTLILLALLACTLHAAETIHIGVLARDGESVCFRRWGATADYLTAETPQYRFEIVPLTFEQVTKTIEERDLEFVLANPSLFIRLEESNLTRPLVTLRGRFHGSGFGSVIFWRADRLDMRSAADMAGKRVAAVSPDSLGGWLAAAREFHDAGINIRRDAAHVDFLQRHYEVVRSVMDGKADVGICRTGTLETMVERGELDPETIHVARDYLVSRGRGAVLASTRLYPEWPLLIFSWTDPALAERVREALLAMPPDSQAAVDGRTAGWVVPADYTSVRQLRRTLGLPGKPVGFRHFVVALRSGETWASWILIASTAVVILALLLGIQHHRASRAARQRATARYELASSRRFLQTVVEQIPHPFAVIGLDYQVLMANRAAQVLYGWTKQDGMILCHQLMRGLEEPCHVCDAPCILQKILASGTPESIITTHRTADGRTVHFQVFGSPIFDSEGQIQQVIEWSLDITDNVRSEERVTGQRDLLGTMIEAIPGPVFLKDDSGVHVAASDAFCDLFGLAVGDIVEKRSEDFMPPDIAATFAQFEEELREKEGTIEGDVVLADRQGHPRNLRMRLRLCQCPDGAPLGIVGVGTETEPAPNHLPIGGAADANLREALRKILASADSATGDPPNESATDKETDTR